MSRRYPKNNIMPWWMKNDSEPVDTNDAKSTFDILGGSTDRLKKRILLTRVLEVVSGTKVLSEAFIQAMAADAFSGSTPSRSHGVGSPAAHAHAHDIHIIGLQLVTTTSAPSHILSAPLSLSRQTDKEGKTC
jgi:hypothetical protein